MVSRSLGRVRMGRRWPGLIQSQSLGSIDTVRHMLMGANRGDEISSCPL
jgi:hypothetical protein